MKQFGVILPAAGMSSRMESSRPKQFMEIAGKPLFYYSLKLFHIFSEIGQIILVLPEFYLQKYSFLLETFPKLKLVKGGEERIISVRCGVDALDEDIQYVLVHDVARPLVSQTQIQTALDSFQTYEAFVSGCISQDTIKQVTNDQVVKTINRDQILIVQTPQGYRVDLLKQAYQKLDILVKQNSEITFEQFTDEAFLLEYLKIQVHWIKSSSLNRKLTYYEDFEWFEQCLKRIYD